MKIQNTVIIGIVLNSLATSAGAQEFDATGCWKTQPSCVSSDSHWEDDDTYVSVFTNNCGGRIYIRYCNQRKRQELHWACDWGPLGNRQTVTLRTWGGATGGPTKMNWMGSRDVESDKVCGRAVQRSD